MENHIKIRKTGGTWVVRAGGAVLGESADALELNENGYDPVIYFPREDIAMAFLEASQKKTICPHKGEANYFSIQTKSILIENAAWSYETPKNGVKEIAGHLAFFPDKAAVEEL